MTKIKEQPAPIGHNHPPFDPATIVDLEILADQVREAYQFKFDRRDELMAGIAAWLERCPNITADDEQAYATDLAAQIMAEIDAIHGKPGSIHTVAKEPFLKGGRIIDGILKGELADRLRAALEPVQKAMKDYAIAKHKAAVAAQQEAARKAAEEAAAAQAALRPSSTEDEHQAALDAEQAAIDASATAAHSKPAANTRTYGDFGATSGLRGTWKVRITDVDKVPRAYMMPDMAMIEAKMQSSRGPKKGPPTAQIPGVEFFEDFSLAVRR